MSSRDWTGPEAYAHMMGYEAAEFAAEYLLRNDAFIRECRALAGGQEVESSDLICPPDFAMRWRLRFHRGG